MIDDRVNVADPDAPDVDEPRVVESDSVAPGVEVCGGVNDHESRSGPTVHERFVTVHGPRVAVREHNERKVVPVDRCGDLHGKRDRAVGGGHDDRLDGDDSTFEQGGSGHDGFSRERVAIILTEHCSANVAEQCSASKGG